MPCYLTIEINKISEDQENNCVYTILRLNIFVNFVFVYNTKYCKYEKIGVIYYGCGNQATIRRDGCRGQRRCNNKM